MYNMNLPYSFGTYLYYICIESIVLGFRCGPKGKGIQIHNAIILALLFIHWGTYERIDRSEAPRMKGKLI